MLLFSVLIFIIGLLIGSFLGVAIDRLPKGKSIIKGRSYCDYCKHTLGLLDLFPVFSYMFLKGKCRYCNKKLSFFYPAIELITAVVFFFTLLTLSSPLTIYNFKFFVNLTYVLLMISSFIVIFFIDLRYKIIPDKILIFDTALTLIWLIFNPQSVIINHILSAIGSFLSFLIIFYGFYFITKKEGMGGGDIKLSFILGLFLGFPSVVSAFYLAFLIGAVFSVLLIIFRKGKLTSALPFGPFLITGTLLSFYFQNQIYPIFLRLLGF